MMDSSMLLFLLEINRNGDWHSASRSIAWKIWLCSKPGTESGSNRNHETCILDNSGNSVDLTAIVLFFYRLNKKRYNEIVEDLKKGKSHSNNA